MSIFSCIGRPAIFTLEPERAHALSIAGLKTGLVLGHSVADERLHVNLVGLNFPNPLGMAAGFDKNAEVVNPLLRLGFGFTEIGTVTPRPQTGNQRPRLFRLVEDEAIINRMGFNNEGHETVYRRLKTLHCKGIIGVNIGANKDSEDRVADYVAGVQRFYEVADYFAINISSPNTPGLRDLQNKQSLSELLHAVTHQRQQKIDEGESAVPIFVKIAPDLDEPQLEEIATVVSETTVDGIIIANTTLSRDGIINHRYGAEAGGLSGKPLFVKSTIILAKMRKLLGVKMPIIGVGGVSSSETFLEKIRAGADLVQLYTALVYHGPGLARTILTDTLKQLENDGMNTITHYRDLSTKYWADKSLS